MTALYSSTALSVEGIMFIRKGGNPSSAIIDVGEEQKDKEYNEHTVATIYGSFHSNKVAGHVPL